MLQVHIVRFNAQNQIQQIRLYWDQGSLLKQVEVIGSRGRNWPIRDAQDQLRLLNYAVSSAATGTTTPSSVAAQSSNDDKNEESSRPLSPSRKPLKDPHAAESLFDLLSPGQDRTQPAIAPRATGSSKPPQRDYSELFVGDDDTEETPAQNGSHNKKQTGGVTASKAGASKTFQRSRLFDDDETVAAEEKEKKEPRYKTHPDKFSHFELGGDNSEREIKPIPSRPKSQHVSSWNFEDFSTPEKPKGKVRDQDIRHFGWSDDEGDLQEAPPAKPRVAHPRRDAETHFQLQDYDTPTSDNTGTKRIVGSAHNRGLALYKNNLYDEEAAEEAKPPLSVVPNGTHRKKDFDSHWSISDTSPPEDKANRENKRIGSDRLKAVKMMNPSWDTYDQSPEQHKVAPPKRISRNVNERSWGFGDEDF